MISSSKNCAQKYRFVLSYLTKKHLNTTFKEQQSSTIFVHSEGGNQNGSEKDNANYNSKNVYSIGVKAQGFKENMSIEHNNYLLIEWNCDSHDELGPVSRLPNVSSWMFHPRDASLALIRSWNSTSSLSAPQIFSSVALGFS